MRFKIIDFFNYYKLDSTAYILEIFVTPMTERDFKIIVEKLKYYCRKDNISWLAVYSTIDSATAHTVVNRTGKRGRPQKTILGQKIGGHTHTVLLGTRNKSAYNTAKLLKKSVDKKYKKRVCKVKSIGNGWHSYNMIGYCFRQADILRTGGTFDFKNYYNSHNKFDNMI